MADAVRVGPAVSSAVARHGNGRVGRAGYRQAVPAFHHVLASAMARQHAPRSPLPATAGSVASASVGIQFAAFRVPLAVPPTAPAEQPAPVIPAHADVALQQAMRLEGVPDSWKPALRFIMAKESSGKVDAKNPVHSARGLFQLTAANYHLNPNGVRSFGNAVEEAQGGIRYIQQRYRTADNALAFWQQHRWY